MKWCVVFLVFTLAGNALASLSSTVTVDYFAGIPYLVVKDQPKLTKVRSFDDISPAEIPYSALDFVGLVKLHQGYEAEEYNVTTTDDYILVLHRLYATSHVDKKRPVVYMQHGLLASSDSWIILGPNISLAYQLADQGYDVWLGNVRGNTYSRYHKNYSPDINAEQFFNFSFEEMALYDVPKLIDTVLEKTEKSQLIYIGHSMGTVMSYIMLSMLPDYSNKIDLLVSLAPVAFFTGTYATANTIMSLIMSTTIFNTVHEVLPHTTIYPQYATDFKDECHLLFRFIMDTEHLNKNNIPQLLRYFPSGTSLKTLTHLQQLLIEGKFARYDYGCQNSEFDCLNKIIYNTEAPPEYNLTNVTPRTILFYAEDDVVADVEDVKLLKSKLPNVIFFTGTTHKKFNHNDFLWSDYAKTLVYNKLITLLKTFGNCT